MPFCLSTFLFASLALIYLISCNGSAVPSLTVIAESLVWVDPNYVVPPSLPPSHLAHRTPLIVQTQTIPLYRTKTNHAPYLPIGLCNSRPFLRLECRAPASTVLYCTFWPIGIPSLLKQLELSKLLENFSLTKVRHQKKKQVSSSHKASFAPPSPTLALTRTYL
jgi:hypothetical protein